MIDISQKQNLTLYSDETSKFGKSYEVFVVSDEDKNSYVLGLREMQCKGSETVVDTLKEILHDINEICAEKDIDDCSVGFKLLTNIKKHNVRQGKHREKISNAFGRIQNPNFKSCYSRLGITI